MRIVSAVYVDQGLYFKMILQDCIGRTRLNSDLEIGCFKADQKLSDPEDSDSDLVIQFCLKPG